MKEEDLKKEAERLGWDVEYLKAHWKKEERIKRLSKNESRRKISPK